jgi:hypothetical protein
MKPSNENHQQGIKRYFYSPTTQPIILAAEEIATINLFLARLYADLGSIVWIKSTFTAALDAYWKTKGATKEYAQRFEEEIDPQIHQVVIARQFTRADPSVIKNYVIENTVDTARYWNAYSDPYPPPDIGNMDEPFRHFFVLLKDLVQEMEKRGNPAQAISFLASVMAAFALTYPVNYLAADHYFQNYVKNEVGDKPTDDDYTFYLCRDMDYMFFDRF